MNNCGQACVEKVRKSIYEKSFAALMNFFQRGVCNN